MNLLIAENPMIVCPTLAVRIGLHEAVFLQQVHFLTLHSRNVRDGFRWVYNTYEDWLEIFPFFENEQKIGRYVRKLEDLGLLVTSKEYNSNKLSKRKWYRVNYASDLLVPERRRFKYERRRFKYERRRFKFEGAIYKDLQPRLTSKY